MTNPPVVGRTNAIPEPDFTIGWTKEGAVFCEIVLGGVRASFLVTPEKSQQLGEGFALASVEAAKRQGRLVVVPGGALPPPPKPAS